MIDRRALLALLAAAGAAPARAAEPLADQPALPGPLSRYRDLPVRRIDGEAETLGACWARAGGSGELLGHLVRALRPRRPPAGADPHAVSGRAAGDGGPQPRHHCRWRPAGPVPPQGGDELHAGARRQAAYLEIAGRAQLALPRTYIFDSEGQPLAAFGRFFGARTLSAIDEAVRRAVTA
jgi:hypothetical protein